MPKYREHYFTPQRISRGRALLGIAILAAIGLRATLTVIERAERFRFRLGATAATCIVFALVFFTVPFPANQQTQNWAVAPKTW